MTAFSALVRQENSVMFAFNCAYFTGTQLHRYTEMLGCCGVAWLLYLQFTNMWAGTLPCVLSCNDGHEALAFQAILRHSHGPLVTKLVSQ